MNNHEDIFIYYKIETKDYIFYYSSFQMQLICEMVLEFYETKIPINFLKWMMLSQAVYNKQTLAFIKCRDYDIANIKMDFLDEKYNICNKTYKNLYNIIFGSKW